MASIERTAYPRLKQNFTKAELRDFYTPTMNEIFFVREKARRDETQLHLLVRLKVFERLGYFPNLEDVAENLIKHPGCALKLPADILPVVSRNSSFHHQRVVRQFFKVKSHDRAARRLTTKAVYEAAQVMDNPADLINAAIEHLIIVRRGEMAKSSSQNDRRVARL